MKINLEVETSRILARFHLTKSHVDKRVWSESGTFLPYGRNSCVTILCIPNVIVDSCEGWFRPPAG